MLFDEPNYTNIDHPVYSDDYAPVIVFDAISYAYDGQEFVKMIDLDKCERPSFESLMNNILFMRKISYIEELAQCLQFPTRSICKGNILEIYYPHTSLGSLRDFMEASPSHYRFNEELLCRIAAKIAVALNIVHRNRLIFRSLNPYHILLIPDGQEVKIKLCGLGGLCRYYPFRNDLPLNEVSWRGWHYNQYEQNPIVWFSPEVLMQDYTGYDQSADIYSFGLILASLYSGKAPFSETNDPAYIYLKKLTETPDSLIDDCEFVPSEELLDLYYVCTNKNPCLRINSSQLLENPWIKRGLELNLSINDLAF